MMPIVTRKLAITLAGVALLLALLALARVLMYYQHLDQPLHLQQDYLLEVGQGSNLTRVLTRLEQEAIIPSAFDLRLYARLTLPDMTLQAGEYLLQPGLSARAFLDKLDRADVLYHQVRLQEGWTLEQALRALQAQPTIKPVLNDVLDLQQRLGLDSYPEGLFFPDTYRYVKGTTDLELLRRAQALMSEVMTQVWEERDAGLPYANPYEMLVMASIIEKETAVNAERFQIAGVFVRRLQRNMRLQTDPTVIYGLGAGFDGNLTRAHLQSDTPWNTYTRPGLPPTPIALPGRAALEASVHPDDGETLYFVSRGDGSHYFSTTLQEHNDAVRRYQLGGGATP